MLPNVREDAGLSVAAASKQLVRLIQASLGQRVSGIGLHLEPMRLRSWPLAFEHGDTATTSDTSASTIDPGE